LVIKKDFRIGVSLKAEARYRASAFNDTIGGLVDWWIGGLVDWWIGGLVDWWISGLVDW
jgi:hypothetical protein